jgi:hypothetical protein
MKHYWKSSIGMVMSIAIGLMIVLFLSGKIIDIPRGTPEGGLISAFGVLLIIVCMVALGYGFHRFIEKSSMASDTVD